MEEQIQEIFKIGADDVRLEQPLAEIPGWNSLRFVKLITRLESMFEVQFHAHEFATLRTWRHLLDLLQEKAAHAK